jgi:hypothetical protein
MASPCASASHTPAETNPSAGSGALSALTAFTAVLDVGPIFGPLAPPLKRQAARRTDLGSESVLRPSNSSHGNNAMPRPRLAAV